MAKENNEKKRTKRPTALKRDIQNARRHKRNRAFKSTVRTAMNAYTTALKDAPEAALQAYKNLQSLMDKGVKKGIYQINKAARLKSKLSDKLAASKQ